MFEEWWGQFALDVAVIVLAATLDRVLPEPPTAIHPVVWIGRATDLLARRRPGAPVAAFSYGAAVVVLMVGVSGFLAWLVMDALMTFGPVPYVLGGAVLFRTTFTVRGLAAAADTTRHALEEDRLDDARESLKALVSRDAATLTPPLVAAAAVESVAENTTDSYISPWLAFAILGVPGAVAYRAVNTLDSMLGFRGPNEYLGKAAARLDDLVNLIPARLSALLLLTSGAAMRLPVARAWRGMLRDQRITESPNAGWTMGAAAWLLGIELEKPGHYRLGQGLRDPQARDIAAVTRLSGYTAAFGALLAIGVLAARHAIVG
ncbi:MAG: adenosylcobinamide-phosphate synthase CbiB [Chloroflexota bacterium]|nr:adenosylcobinamide-phosphate synthase CbiB [Chloroflexota bacterium]